MSKKLAYIEAGMVGSDQNYRQIQPDHRPDRPLAAEAESQNAEGWPEQPDARTDLSDRPSGGDLAGDGQICQPADRDGKEQEKEIRQSWDESVLKNSFLYYKKIILLARETLDEGTVCLFDF